MATRPDTVCDLASLTKTFTAVLALRLVEGNQLDLDGPLAHHLASFVDKPAITVRRLVTHTSGQSKDTPLGGGTPAADLGLFGRALLDGGCAAAAAGHDGADAHRRQRPLRAGRRARARGRRRPGVVHGRLAGHGAFGHTGFTGTSMVLDPHRRVILVLPTNRVHPDAAWGTNNPARKAAGGVLDG